MSESLPERLSRFTPDSSGLDRDALLFAAGRASVRPGRRWLIVAGVLAASQLLTLSLLWIPRPSPNAPFEDRGPSLVEEPVGPATPLDPSAWWALRDRALATEGNLSAPTADDSLAAPEPPLRAFLSPRSTLLH